MGARRELSLGRNKGQSVNGPSSWDPRRPPPGGTAQVQLGGVYGNYSLELILIWKLLLGTDFNMKQDRLCIGIGVLVNLMHM